MVSSVSINLCMLNNYHLYLYHSGNLLPLKQFKLGMNLAVVSYGAIIDLNILFMRTTNPKVGIIDSIGLILIV